VLIDLIAQNQPSSNQFFDALLSEIRDEIFRTWTSRPSWLQRGFGISIAGDAETQIFDAQSMPFTLHASMASYLPIGTLFSQATVVMAGRSRGGPPARSAWSFRGHQGRSQSLLALFAGKVASRIGINAANRKQKVPGVAAVAPGAAARVT
jgi:hypothetical protein